MNKKTFPKNFLWGAATSSHQIEGGLTNNWSRWEKERVKNNSELDSSNYLSGKAADSFNRYKEDVRIMKELGFSCYRFSVDWSRIEPEKGKISEEGIQYYKSLIKELKDNGIEPFLTCWHWTLPLWLEEEGGLLAKDIVKYFQNYVDILVKNFGNDVKFWITINEPLVVGPKSYLVGEWPPQKKSPILMFRVVLNLIKMHREGYRVIKEFRSDLQVSIAKHNQFYRAHKDRVWNRGIVKVANYIVNEWFLDRIEGYMDFIGLNFYFDLTLSLKGIIYTEAKRSDIDWEINPYSIYYVLKHLKDRYDIPVYITENGLADGEDKHREWWIDETVKAMEDALDYGVDLRGYMHWSLLDNFEWADGFGPKFGLVEIDRDTQNRRVRDSAYHYSKIIERNR